jgi:hypothetical protein
LVSINLLANPVEIIDRLKSIVAEKMKTKAVQSWRTLRIFTYPTEPFHYSSVKQHLVVYDLYKTGKHWREIAAEITPHAEYSEALRVALFNELKKAKKIIQNVEQSRFPGKY